LEHLALDEVLLDSVAAGERGPCVRFWRWTQKALVLGSHQSVRNEVDPGAAAELGFAVVRRMSGGGTMVCEPGGTLTYSLYLPDSFLRGLSFVESFRALDAWVVAALVELGVPASYRPINDIVSPSGKIAGAAQTDAELRALDQALGAEEPLRELREAGIGGVCNNCGAVHGSEDRFCATCGEPLGRNSHAPGHSSEFGTFFTQG